MTFRDPKTGRKLTETATARTDDEARKLTNAFVASVLNNKVATAVGKPTVEEVAWAWLAHKTSIKKLAEGTVANYEWGIEKIVAVWGKERVHTIKRGTAPRTRQACAMR